MDWQASLQTIAQFFQPFSEWVQTTFPNIDPQYLMLIMAVLIWVQLGRIVAALKTTGGLPKDLPRRVQSLQQKVQHMSNEIADFQAYASRRGGGPVSTYRDVG